MIIVKIFRDKQGTPYGFSCKGHSDHAPMGFDIFCSAVTAMAGATITGLTDVLMLKPRYSLSEGDIECEVDLRSDLTKEQRDGAVLLFKTFELGCKQIVDSYEEQNILLIGHNMEVQDNVET